MSSAIIWIFFPIVISMGLWWFQTRAKLTWLVGTGCAFLLAFLAALLPVGTLVTFGPLRFRIDAVFYILGRSLTIDQNDLPIIILLYTLVGVWLFISRAARANSSFVPLGLLMVSLCVAALAVDPFLYAALLIEMAVLVSIPMMVPPRSEVGKGVLRYLIFQTLGMPFILFTGWMLSGLETGSTDASQMVRAWTMLGLGFAFLLAVFPFYTWIPMLSQENSPFETGFILSLLPTVILLFAITFLDRYSWMRSSESLYTGLRLVGVLMVITSGIWAAFQNHLSRIFGYTIIQETGFLLLAAGFPSGQGLPYFFMLLLPRLLGLCVFSLGLAMLYQKTPDLSFKGIQGLGRIYPWISAAIVVANLSIAGFPLLADFPVKQAILIKMSAIPGNMVQLTLLGSIGLVIGGLRTMMALSHASEPETNGFTSQETIGQRILFCAAILGLVFVGLFPQLFLPGMTRLIEAFEHLV